MIRRGDRVTVVDPWSEHCGTAGMVAADPGATSVFVQLDGRDCRDLELFRVDQLEPRFSVAA